MDDHELWAAIDDQRRRTTDLLDSLSDADWTQPSLCDGWTVRDVAAHLTMQQAGLGTFIPAILKYGLKTNHVNHRWAVDKAAAVTPSTLVAEIRAMIGSRKHVLVVTSRETLIDNLVHTQDIVRPLGRHLPMQPAAAAEGAARVYSYLGTKTAAVFASIPWQALRFAATDVAWSAGDGPLITGTAEAILLTLTGRRVALAELNGDPGAIGRLGNR